MIAWILLQLTLGALAAGEQSKCDKLASLAAWRDHNTLVETSLKTLTGTWVSEGCETRPGPEYVLRSYSFQSDGVYELIQHRYWDDSCSSPKLTIMSHGRIQLRNSLIQPGAFTGIARPLNITVIPQDAQAAEELDKIVAKECSGQYWKAWRRNEEHIVYDNKFERRTTFNLWSQSYQPVSNHVAINSPRNALHSSGNINCLDSLKWAFNELKLVKIQLRPILHTFRKHTPTQMEMELLLGDIHSSKRRREFYQPTGFQVPLLRQTKGENITIQKHQYLIKSPSAIPINLVTNMKTPPHLIERPHLPPYIWGEWTSTRCEVRPLDVYLVRRFAFIEEDLTWVGEHRFYSDPFCTYQKFIVTAAGHFTLPGPSEEMKGITNIDFQIERATLTAMDARVITDMRLSGFCGLGEWQVNVPKELGATGGCIYLGIIIPSVRFDIIKVEMDYKGNWQLFMGQADTNNLPNTANERPTAFQLPLNKCGDVPYYPHSTRGALERRYYSNTSSRSFEPSIPFLSTLLTFFFSIKYYCI